MGSYPVCSNILSPDKIDSEIISIDAWSTWFLTWLMFSRSKHRIVQIIFVGLKRLTEGSIGRCKPAQILTLHFSFFQHWIFPLWSSLGYSPRHEARIKVPNGPKPDYVEELTLQSQSVLLCFFFGLNVLLCLIALICSSFHFQLISCLQFLNTFFLQLVWTTTITRASSII